MLIFRKNYITCLIIMAICSLLFACNNEVKNVIENTDDTYYNQDICEEVVVARSNNRNSKSVFNNNSVSEIKEQIKSASIYDKESGLTSDVIVSFGKIKKGGEKGEKINWIVLEKQNGKALLLSQEALFYLNFLQIYVLIRKIN